MTEDKASTPAIGRIAWLTGASKGIGRAVALELASAGWTVAASARDAAALEALAAEAHVHPGAIHVYPLDITSEAAARDVVARIENDLGPLELAVLNAGTHEPVDGSAFSVAPLKRLVDVNLMGTAHCLAPVVERFVGRRTGRIAVVASLAGYRGLPTASAYGATKAALINMCEALRVELDQHGVVVSVITPGFVRTPLTDQNPFPMPFLIEPETAARRMVRGLAGRRFEITFPRRFAAIMKVLRLLPYPVYFAATRRLVAKNAR